MQAASELEFNRIKGEKSPHVLASIQNEPKVVRDCNRNGILQEYRQASARQLQICIVLPPLFDRIGEPDVPLSDIIRHSSLFLATDQTCA